MTRLTRASQSTSQNDLITSDLSEDGKKIVFAINARIDSVHSEFLRIISEKTKEIKDLKSEVGILRNKLTKMEEKVLDSETKERQNNMIFSGERIPDHQPGENCMQIIRNLMDTDLGTIIPSADIESAVRLGKVKNNQSDQPQKMSILVKFRNPLHKSSIKSKCKVKKPKFFVNEDLPSEKQTILYVLRKCKKKYPNIVSGSASIDGHISAWIKPQSPNETAQNRRVSINSVEKLRQFCTNYLCDELSSFIQEWRH